METIDSVEEYSIHEYIKPYKGILIFVGVLIVCGIIAIILVGKPVSCKAGTHGTNGKSPWFGSCIECEAGKYTNKSGSSECTECNAGEYSDSGSSECSKCNAGTYSLGNASECKVCEAGKYSDSGSSECGPCRCRLTPLADGCSKSKLPNDNFKTIITNWINETTRPAKAGATAKAAAAKAAATK